MNLYHALAQLTYRQILKRSYQTFPDRLKARFFTPIYHWIKNHNPPLIRYPIGSYELWMSFDHELPLILQGYPQYTQNLVRLTQQISQEISEFKMIDVGANIGDTVALLNLKGSTLCIEGNPYFFKILEKNAKVLKNIELVQTLLGETSQSLQGILEYKLGTGRIIPTSDVESLTIQTLPEVLEQYPHFREARLLKIDTDGFDCQVLRGAKSWLMEAKPVIFFEYDPHYLRTQKEVKLSIFKDLKDWGYFYLLIYDNVGDFMLSSTCDSISQLKELHDYLLRKDKLYCDICVFHELDRELFKSFQNQEHQILP
ncbi:FkbM family methyltransferase [Spirulina subsalsa FACHB-351]|uniref:FkbM family methyltransferase n=1 Tax=Spirulina subsalsa FACHB-351 TaxID=234711 RepID=A0ABT3L616_9CYAN|nr:FkbM family methyltransferase [Spirulina subsalsa]MCW6036952.1 FkbM family methyltransferase [Spirulina subsalsa FACHB-351]